MPANAQNDTLSIRPVGPGGSLVPHATHGNNSQAAHDARVRIISATQPISPLPVVDVPEHKAKANHQPGDKPTSPAEQVHAIKPMAKPKLPSKIKPVLNALAFFLLILALFKAPVMLNQVKYLFAKPTEPTITARAAGVSAVSSDPIMIIPKINVSAPVIYPTSTSDGPNYDPDLEHGVVHYPNTALPGQTGNTVIFGHSSNDWWQPGEYKFVFVLLDKTVVGDTMSINYKSKQYVYQVTTTKVVEATDVSVLNSTSTPTLTLITCWPAGTNLKRFIVQAKQISPKYDASVSSPAKTTPSSSQALPSAAPGIFDGIKTLWTSIKDTVAGKPTEVKSDTPTTTLPAAQ